MDLWSWPESGLDDYAAYLDKLLVHAPAPERFGFPTTFRSAGDSIVLVEPNIAQAIPWQHAFGATSFAEHILGRQWGEPQAAEARVEDALADLLKRLDERKFPHSVSRIGKGGLAVALALACDPKGLGVRANLARPESESALHAYFGEEPSRLLLTCKGHAHFAISNFVEYGGRFIATAIGRVTDGEFSLEWERKKILTTRL